MRAAWFLGILAVSCGCRTARLEPHVNEYVRLAMALGERDPDSLDFYFGSPALVAEIRKNPPRLEEIRRRADALLLELQQDPQPRARRLAKQVKAISARAAELDGSASAFEQAALAYFGLSIQVADSGEDTRSQIARLLPGKEPLAERYAAFDAKFTIPPERLPAVFERAMAACHDRTLQAMPLPEGESISIEYVHDKPWSAFSRYQGNFHSLIQVNADLAVTVDRVLDLACHEGYPGHHAFNVLHELRFVRGKRWMEWAVQPSFSPQSLVSEALATLGAEIAFPDQERVRFERDVLFPLAGLDPGDVEKYVRIGRLIQKLAPLEAPIARDFVDGKLEWARAAAALESGPLMAHPEQTLKYINEYRTYMLTYTLGHALAARQVQSWQQFRDWIDDPDAASRIIMNP